MTFDKRYLYHLVTFLTTYLSTAIPTAWFSRKTKLLREKLKTKLLGEEKLHSHNRTVFGGGGREGSFSIVWTKL